MFKKLLVSAVSITSILSSTSFAAEPGAFLMKFHGGYTMTDSAISSVAGKNENKALNSTLKNKNTNGLSIGVGFGYVASDEISTDVTVSFDSLKSKTDDKNTAITKIENNTVSAMMNGYYNFNTASSLSPYVMMGLGAAMSKTTAMLPKDKDSKATMMIDKTTVGSALPNQLKSKNTTYFAYQGGFGVQFETIKSVSLDLGYRIGNHQGGKFDAIKLTGDDALTLKPKTQLKQSIILGVNIAF